MACIHDNNGVGFACGGGGRNDAGGQCDPPDNSELINGTLVSSIGAAHNKSGAQVSIRWLVQSGVPAIPRSRNPIYTKADLDVFDFTLTDAEMAALNAATKPPNQGTGEDSDCVIP